jgi:beta-lactamase class D
MALVREIMLSSEPGAHGLRAKTGWARTSAGHQVGWYVGWVERADNVHFFATAVESPAPREDFGQLRAAVTREVLEALGILGR